jgi:hypothetical protein
MAEMGVQCYQEAAAIPTLSLDPKRIQVGGGVHGLGDLVLWPRESGLEHDRLSRVWRLGDADNAQADPRASGVV